LFEGFGSHGPLFLFAEDLCFFLPAPSTLRAHLPVIDPDKGLTDSDCLKLKQALESRGNKGPFHGGLTFDEMEILKGLRYDQATGRLFGLSPGYIAEKDVNSSKYTDEYITSHLGRYIFQVFVLPTLLVLKWNRFFLLVRTERLRFHFAII
jgi:hypothetical protein